MGKKLQIVVAPLLALGLVATVVGWAVRDPDGLQTPRALPQQDDLAATVSEVDGSFETTWNDTGLQPVATAEPLTVLRRLSLALHGTIPSLEEIRQFERELANAGADGADGLISRWTVRMLDDRRFADYFAERLARGLVGTEDGAFIVYRRDRFVEWLADQLDARRPWDHITRDIIAEQGLWTGKPAVNFITAAVAEGEIDRNKLAGKTVRAFLGQRIDCAQCHDHPFDQWKQADFEGLAAFYGQANLTLVGIEDKPSQTYEVEDRMTLEMREVEPGVPFHPEWLPESGALRQRLASWITHPENRRFERAIANRVWALLFGTPYYTMLRVDDLPDPPSEPDLLDLLGRDLREHDYDLRRLILIITSSRPFRLSSQSDAETDEEYDLLKSRWCVFPMVRLRPEQLIGAMLQASSVKTIDRNSHLFFRAIRFFRERDFVRDYGDLGADELDERAGTVTQALLRMNGRLTREIIDANPLSSTLRVSQMSTDDRECVENSFLVCLGRRPTPDEAAYFQAQLEGLSKGARNNTVEDLYWSLFNSLEFSWNH